VEKAVIQNDMTNHEEIVRAALDGSQIINSSEIDDLTLRSWRRCRDEYGLDPSMPPDPVIIDRQNLCDRLQKYERLLDIARVEMTDLYQQLAGSGHAIMLTDKDGILLNFIGDPQFTDAAAHTGMQLGAVWSESVQGTNGMGTCLVEQKPLVIHKQSHFFSRNATLTCAAAPIFDPHGDILAVLDASSESKMAQQHTMVLLNMSAQVIENRVFFCAMKEAFVLRFHSRSEFISTLGEGAIAFDTEGKIEAIKLVERDVPCMLFGETGTGKEMFARALHQASSRHDKAFVAVNCASLPESLIESELFGYRPGAFTGANRDGSRGKIVQADGGTLFLDEIGDMPLHLQARLLRVLEEREVTPLGGEKPIKVSIKLISATHHNIKDIIEDGDFREDLYYRLHGVSLTMPPLRERTDRLQLIKHIAQLEADISEELNWEPDALKLLENFNWPGNIRQLRNVLRTSTALCENNIVTVNDLPDEIRNTVYDDEFADGPEANLNALAIAERDALLSELEEMHWNISRVAKKLGLSRNTLYRRMKRFGITPPR
jgi:transcriptional regulator of acetoin/glycerol metabolism